MKGLCKIALAALVVAACGGDLGITEPVSPNAPSSGGGILAIGVDTVTGATIETNKDDYVPGEVVHLVGHGWAPNETVNLHMTEEPNTHADVDTNVTADATGGFNVHFYDVQTHDWGVEFTLTATGLTSGSVAKAVFTDGSISTDGATIETRDAATCTSPTGSVVAGTAICAHASFTIVGTGATRAQLRWKNPSGAIVHISQKSPSFANGETGPRIYSASYTPTDPGTWTVLLCESDNSTLVIGAGGLCQAGTERASGSFDVTPAPSKSDQTISFTPPTPKTFGDADFAISATATSGLLVTFTSQTTDKCTVAGSTVQIVEAGTCTIRASQAGNGSFNPAPDVDGNITINKAGQTITFTPPASKSILDPDFVISATATSGLTVSFTSLTTDKCTVSGTTVHLVAVGTCTIRASQAGNVNYDPAPNVDGNITINIANQSISFTPPTPKTFGDPDFTISATATSGLTVSFTSLTTGKCTVSGTTVHIVEAGLCTIRASQAGNATYAPASDVDGNIQIDKADQTISFTPPTPKTFGDPDFTISATATSGLTVSFASQTTNKCTVSGTTVHIVEAGLCTIRATQVGNVNYNPAPHVDGNIQIDKADQTISFTPPTPKTFGDLDFTISATATSGLTVSFASQTTNKCTVSGTTVHIVEAGLCTIRATQAGNINYNPAPHVDGNIQIDKANQTITFNPPTTKIYGDPDFAISATATSTLSVSFSSLTTDKCTVAGSTVHIVAAGTCTIRASQAGNINYNAAPNVDKNIEINKATISSTPSVSPTTQQYSDKITPSTVLAAQTGGLPSGTLTGTVTFKLGSSTIGTENVSVSSLPATITEQTPYPLAVPEGSYSITAVFEPAGDNFAAGTSGSASLTVTPEDMNITPDANNVTEYSTSTSTTVSLKFNVSEKGTTEDNNSTASEWAVGSVNLQSNFSAKLNPVSVGSVANGTCSQFAAAPSATYNAVRVIKCDFANVVPDAYEVVFTVGTATPTTDDYYAGVWDKGIVAVSDPNAALPSGGGWIPMEDSKLNFGFNFSYSGPKNNKTVRGGLVAIRHFTSGTYSGWVCRVKTNSLNAPSATAQLAANAGWYSTFSGTNVSYNCKDANGVIQESAGNQSLAAYVEDRGEPGRYDKFWLKVTGKINMTAPAATNALTLGGGNLQVPKP